MGKETCSSFKTINNDLGKKTQRKKGKAMSLTSIVEKDLNHLDLIL